MRSRARPSQVGPVARLLVNLRETAHDDMPWSINPARVSAQMTLLADLCDIEGRASASSVALTTEVDCSVLSWGRGGTKGDVRRISSISRLCKRSD